MGETPRWEETESRVHIPGLWLLFLVGTVFLALGVSGLIAVLERGPISWIISVGPGVFAVFGAIILAIATRSVIRPVFVRHAVLGTLPNVPREPVLSEGSVVHRRLTHELVHTEAGWQFRPQQKLWRDDKRFLLAFGIPFLMMFSGLVSWIIHHELNIVSWPVSIACGISITLLCGGSCFLLIGLLIRGSYRRLCWLNVPQNGNDLVLDAPEEISSEQTDLTSALKWLGFREINRHQVTIPRGLIGAVQVCPWNFVIRSSGSKSSTWAVQGSLILKSSAEGAYCRVPLLLTSDFAGAARLMQRLAATLNVPYLFHADAAGWHAEEAAAKQRLPMRFGGMET